LKAFFEAGAVLMHSERDEPKNTIEVAVESGLLFLIIAVLNLFFGGLQTPAIYHFWGRS
jgi:hypothetical protein